MPEQSKTRPTVGRVLHAHSPKWSGPRPAIVVNEIAANENLANVNILFDGFNDTAMLALVRKAASGNTFGSAPVYDPLTAAERAEALEAAPRWTPHEIPIILEWPPRA